MQSDVATYSDIPVTVSTAATLSIAPDSTQNSSIQIDQNSDGKTDVYVSPDGGVLSVDQLLTNITTGVQGLTSKDKLKTQLLNKIATFETKITKQKQKQSNVLAKLQTQVQKKASNGKIDAASAAQISDLLDSLIAQDTTVPLDPALINQLQAQINVLSITPSLKNSLLTKVTQLQNLASITRSLDSITNTISKKIGSGQRSDADTQTVLNLLNQIQNAL